MAFSEGLEAPCFWALVVVGMEGRAREAGFPRGVKGCGGESVGGVEGGLCAA